MQKIILLVITASIVIAVGVFVVATKAPESQDIIASLIQNDPQLETADVSLDGCRLVMRNHQQGIGAGMSNHSVFKVNLARFRFDSSTIVTTNDNRFFIKLALRGDAHLYEEQYLQIFELSQQHFNADSSQDNTQDNTLAFRDLIADSVEPFTFRIMSLVNTSGEEAVIEPPEDAPGFYDFATAVEALPNPPAYNATLSYLSAEQNAQSLFGGQLSVLRELKFSVLSMEHAKELLHDLYDYQHSVCPDSGLAY